MCLRWVPVVLAACGPGNDTPDAGAADAAVDASPPDAGRCPTGQSFFTAEHLDWDSSDAAFLGVFDAAWTSADDPSQTDATSPNGRVELCLDDPAPVRRLNVEAPGAYLDAIVVLRDVDFEGPELLSARTPTAAQLTTLLEGSGVDLDPADGHLLVYFPIDTAPQTITGTPELTLQASLAAGAPTWTEGNQGSYVLFANLAPGTITMAALTGLSLPLDVPIEASKLTIVPQEFALE